MLIDNSAIQFRHFILFSSYPDSNTIDKNISELKIFLTSLVKEYIKQINLKLAPFISSKSSFQNIEGQNDKTILVKFLIKENRKLETLLLPIFKIIDLTLPSSVLVSEETLNHIVDW